MPQHRFEAGDKRYLLLLAGTEQLERAARWTAADPAHAGRVDPSFWIEQGPDCESWLLEDTQGPVFFFKAVQLPEKILEIHVQFAPLPPPAYEWTHLKQRGRIMRALIDGTNWLEGKVRGYFREMRFDSNSPELTYFCVKHLGFKTDKGRLFKELGAI